MTRKTGVLITLIAILIIFQGLTILFFSIKVNELSDNLNLTSTNLEAKIDTSNADINSKINSLTENLMKTQTDLTKQISALKATASSDFSGIIEQSVKGVVTIKTDISQGTGFIITENGYVVTNAHVLSQAKYANAVLSNQNVRPMDLIGYSANLDIALLKIEGTYEDLELANSNDIKVGEKVIAIGNPLGLSFSVTEGIVSATDREGINNLPYYIQTDAALNPGNSGGPLINKQGQAIGINNFKASAENIGFALESNYIKQTVNEISLKALNQTIV